MGGFHRSEGGARDPGFTLNHGTPVLQFRYTMVPNQIFDTASHNGNGLAIIGGPHGLTLPVKKVMSDTRVSHRFNTVYIDGRSFRDVARLRPGPSRGPLPREAETAHDVERPTAPPPVHRRAMRIAAQTGAVREIGCVINSGYDGAFPFAGLHAVRAGIGSCTPWLI